MKKLVLITVLAIAFAYLFSLGASASSGTRITDTGNFLTDEEQMEIEIALMEAERATNMSVRVYTYAGSQYYDYADYMYEHSTKQDLVLLVIQYDEWDDEYYYYVDTVGAPYSLITDKEIDRILDNPKVYNNIKSGNLADGILAYAPLTVTAINSHLRPNIGRVLAVSVIIAAVVAFVTCLCVFLSYRKKQHSPSYPLDKYARLNLMISRDTFLTKTVTRVRINTSSSSGGGSRSGGGGGGRRGGR